MSRFELHLGDCLETLRTMPDNSVDSIVTDPPYGLSFMGKRWDYDVPSVEIWAECLRVLKPGGHLLAFAGTRTQHRMAVRIEDAGFEIRDMIAWVYGSGFPKSLDVSKAIDKAAGAEREVVGTKRSGLAMNDQLNDDGWHNARAGEVGKMVNITAPATEAARQWQGWGTALKPVLEPITVARKPLIGTVAENVLQHGTGAINVDGCRVNPGEVVPGGGKSARGNGGLYGDGAATENARPHIAGRWPANLIHDGSEEVVARFPVTAPAKAANRGLQNSGRHGGLADIGSNIKEGTDTVRGHNDEGGSAARFFYCAKASRADRNEGTEHLEQRVVSTWGGDEDDLSDGKKSTIPKGNHHPTVKPTDLMAYLVRLVTPPGGLVLDPFMGSGSTGKAAMREGFRFIGCEMSPEYLEIARARIESALKVL